MAVTIVPPESARPQVLPSDRLLSNGMCVPEIRSELRRIPDARNLLSVAALWFWIVVVVWIALLLHSPWGYVAAVLIMGTMHVRLAIQMHEAAHRLLLSNKRWNDIVGTYCIAYPGFIPIQVYRRGHFAHHRDEFGPNEPDLAFYSGYPCQTTDLYRRLFRDVIGVSGWKNLQPLFKALTNPLSRRVAATILLTQLILWGASWLVSGDWWVYPLFWLLPWMTLWRVLNRLRSIAEHGGMERSDDRRATTHNVTQHLWTRFCLVPYNTGWHLSHHVDMGIPWRNLPRYHEELASAGYVTDAITYRGYLHLWRTLTSAGEL